MLKVLRTAALVGAFAGLITLITAVLFFSDNSVSLAALAAVAVGFAALQRYPTASHEPSRLSGR